MSDKEHLIQLWRELYSEDTIGKLNAFLSEIEQRTMAENEDGEDWYKDAVIYSLYVDLFNKDFSGLIDKLDYLEDLGVNCLWLLPILDSPMRDAGFDIRNYDRIRADLLGLPEGFDKEDQVTVFGDFLKQAHIRGIRVIFDVAINHVSDEHPWFLEAKKSEDNPFRNYFIWSKDTSLYKEARLLFKGIEESNWEQQGDWYYFHRFFSFQPDWNYKNPDVLLTMSRNLLYWQSMGVDGFRADAIPYLWKEEGTDCENRPKTHTLVKFFRAVLDYAQPGSLLLAEACQKPKEVVKYMGDGDECHAAYHFPLMPMMFKAIAMESNQPIRRTLSPEVTPELPVIGQWLSFLRVHDELSLELVYVSEEDRKYIHENYCRKPEWDFRLGEGISARLSELFQRDERKIGLAYSLMLTITGSPVVYYGDEFGKLNDEAYYREQIKLTGKDDTRFLVRGRIDWKKLEADLKDPDNFHARVYQIIKSLLNTRKEHTAFGRGDTKFLDVQDVDGKPMEQVLAYLRSATEENILVLNNLSGEQVVVKHPLPDNHVFMLNFNGFSYDEENQTFQLEPYGFVWLGVL
jgi:maltose alpha-D-glucosyltransferase/alpha-amylase